HVLALMVCGTRHAVPAGSRGARKALRRDISTSTILTVDAKPVDSIFGWAQGLRVAMHAACWGKSASKFCTIGPASGSPQTQHRSEYRSLAVMRDAQYCLIRPSLQ